MAGIEPIVEESPESDDSKWTVISKYAGDYFFPPVVSEPSSMVTDSLFTAPSWLGGGQVSGLSRDEFFREVRGRFSSIPWQARASRATGIPRAPGAPGPLGVNQPPPGQFPPPGPVEPSFMEALQQNLMAKYRPEARQATMYRTKREAERREGQIKEFNPVVMSKEGFLKALADKIDSVQWKPKNPDHSPIVASRPGVSKKYQEELNDL